MSMLDVGCGEGWLCREFENSSSTMGIDANNRLIEYAKSHGKGDYRCVPFDKIEDSDLMKMSFDCIVLNFCLYLKDESENLLKLLKKILQPGGVIIIQTLHPFHMISKDQSYEDHWVNDSWKGLKGDFTSPHKWYYRTMGNWVKMISQSGLNLRSLQEPLDKKSMPVSVILQLQQ